MKFYIPSMGPENADVVYAGIRAFLANEWGFRLTPRRVQKLSYTTKGQRQDIAVGRQMGTDHETVFAIFETPSLYLICTPKQGVAGRPPVKVKRKDVTEIVDFDAAEAEQPA